MWATPAATGAPAPVTASSLTPPRPSCPPSARPGPSPPGGTCHRPQVPSRSPEHMGSLPDLFADIPDPRRGQGRRHPLRDARLQGHQPVGRRPGPEGAGALSLRIPRKLDTHSSASWTPIPRQPGQSERSDARGGCWGGFLRQSWLEFSQGFPGEVEGVGVMDQAVEDGIGQGRIAQGVVPVGHRQLTGHQGRAGLVTLVEQFE